MIKTPTCLPGIYSTILIISVASELSNAIEIPSPDKNLTITADQVSGINTDSASATGRLTREAMDEHCRRRFEPKGSSLDRAMYRNCMNNLSRMGNNREFTISADCQQKTVSTSSENKSTFKYIGAKTDRMDNSWNAWKDTTTGRILGWNETDQLDTLNETFEVLCPKAALEIERQNSPALQSLELDNPGEINMESGEQQNSRSDTPEFELVNFYNENKNIYKIILNVTQKTEIKCVAYDNNTKPLAVSNYHISPPAEELTIKINAELKQVKSINCSPANLKETATPESSSKQNPQ